MPRKRIRAAKFAKGVPSMDTRAELLNEQAARRHAGPSPSPSRRAVEHASPNARFKRGTGPVKFVPGVKLDASQVQDRRQGSPRPTAGPAPVRRQGAPTARTAPVNPHHLIGENVPLKVHSGKASHVGGERTRPAGPTPTRAIATRKRDAAVYKPAVEPTVRRVKGSSGIVYKPAVEPTIRRAR